MSMGSGDQTTTAQIKYTPQQKTAINAAMPNIMGYLSNPPTIPGISTVLPFNAGQQQANAGLTSQAMGPLSGFSSGMMDISNWLNTGALNPATNPYLAGTAEAAIRPVTENLTENILPSVRHGAVVGGQYGGTRQENAEHRAIRDTQRTAGDMTSQIYSNAFESGMDRIVKNMALAPQTAGLSLMPWQVAGGVANQQYGLDTAMAGDAFNRAMMSQQMPYLASKDVLATMMGLGSGSTTTASGTGGGIGSAIGGGIGGAATAGALGSLPGLSALGGPWGIAGGAALGALASIFR